MHRQLKHYPLVCVKSLPSKGRIRISSFLKAKNQHSIFPPQHIPPHRPNFSPHLFSRFSATGSTVFRSASETISFRHVSRASDALERRKPKHGKQNLGGSPLEGCTHGPLRFGLIDLLLTSAYNNAQSRFKAMRSQMQVLVSHLRSSCSHHARTRLLLRSQED